MNQLFYGDNLEILRNDIEDESIDLIYIDPPFNSKRDYNVLFESIDMTDAKAQKEAFKDTWSRTKYLDELASIQDLDLRLFKYLTTLNELGLSKGRASYLTMMSLRIFFMRKKLKDTGSFYLHCDPTMSHYLKVVCDLIFGEKNFRNEIVWKRTFSTGSSKAIAKRYPTNSDIILFYTKGAEYTFNQLFTNLSKGALKRFDKVDEKGRRYMWNTLKTVSKERYQELLDKGLISESPELKYPRYKRYLDESKGRLIDNIWTDMPFMGTLSEERLGYPTQKPEALLERIISVSSNKGDVVADFFCGCGTTIAVAQKLDRKWIGVDISHLAIRLVYDRLLKQYEGKKRLLKKVRENIKISGFPKDLASARDLAYNTDKSRLQFQDWVVEVMLGGVYNPKRTADGGYDGYLTFNKTDKGKDIILIEVKSGNVSVKNIREFIEVVNKEKASIGTFVCFAEQVTAPMLKWAKEAGYYKPELFGQKYDKIQIITVEEMLAGKLINYPPYQNVTFKNSTGIGITTEEESTTNLFDNSSDEKEYHLI